MFACKSDSDNILNFLAFALNLPLVLRVKLVCEIQNLIFLPTIKVLCKCMSCENKLHNKLYLKFIKKESWKMIFLVTKSLLKVIHSKLSSILKSFLQTWKHKAGRT